MRTIVALCTMMVGGVAVAGESAVVVTPSQPATTVVTGGRPSVIIVEEAPRSPCANGKCRLYSVDERAHEASRRRLFGGQVVRNNSRTVVRPVR